MSNMHESIVWGQIHGKHKRNVFGRFHVDGTISFGQCREPEGASAGFVHVAECQQSRISAFYQLCRESPEGPWHRINGDSGVMNEFAIIGLLKLIGINFIKIYDSHQA